MGESRHSEAFDGAIESFLSFYAGDVVCYPAPGWIDEEVCHGHDGLRRAGPARTTRTGPQ